MSINYHKRSNDFYITLKKTGLKKLWQVFQNLFYSSMVSLKVKQRIYDKNLEIQEVIDASMIEVCAWQVFFLFCFFFAVVFIIIAILENNLNKSVEDIRKAYQNSRDSMKKRKCLVVFMWVFSFKGLIYIYKIFGEALIYLE